jgi:hypothetical protein
MRLLVQLKYRTCVFPTCEMPAQRCDIDHGLKFSWGGLTVLDNLAPICRTHHRLKGMEEFPLAHVGDNLIWATPTGSLYVTGPTRYPVG